MRVLLLGGTAFLGRAIARVALERGAAVTCAARGTGPIPAGADLVRLDRDRDDALGPLRGTTWDAVIDLTSQPGCARRAVRDLEARHWILISTASVYAHSDRPEQAEDAPTFAPLTDDVMADATQYGPAKVACEEAVRGGCRSWTIIRPGLIGGAGDRTGRSGYYPWRFAHPTGADVLVPPDPTMPTALIDVADLAEWVVDCVERRHLGVFNAAGPTTELGLVLETAREVAGSSAVPRPVPADVLDAAGVVGWAGPRSLPLWIEDPAWRWSATLNSDAARARGLHIRPLRQTLAAALAYEEERTEPRQSGLTDDEERELRALLG